jgi:hypothetical protein
MPTKRTPEVIELAPAPSARLLDPHVEDYASAESIAKMNRESVEHLADLAWIREWNRWHDAAHGKTMRAEHIVWWQAAIVGNIWPVWADDTRRSRPNGPPPLNGRGVLLRETADVQDHGGR